LASQWFAFTGITADQFKDVVATGATDEELARWIGKHSKIADPEEVLIWNNRMRDTRLSDMSLQAQQYLEDYIPQFVQNHRPAYVWFDVYDRGKTVLIGPIGQAPRAAKWFLPLNPRQMDDRWQATIRHQAVDEPPQRYDLSFP
jgi:uncharacterized protein DUF5069